MKERYVLSVLAKNSSGVLSRVAGMFSRRGFNIDSLTAGRTETEGISRMTITLVGDNDDLEQVKKQLNKLEDVIKVMVLKPSESVYRELVLIKVKAPEDKRAAISGIAQVFRGKIVDISSDTLTIEVTGDENKIAAIINLLDEYGVEELVRTGLTALQRGNQIISKYNKCFEELK